MQKLNASMHCKIWKMSEGDRVSLWALFISKKKKPRPKSTIAL